MFLPEVDVYKKLVAILQFSHEHCTAMKPIPQPPPRLLIGNLKELDPDTPSLSLARILKQYGPLVKLNIVGREVLIAGSQGIVHELCDQKRFEKVVSGALGEVRHLAGDGENLNVTPW